MWTIRPRLGQRVDNSSPRHFWVAITVEMCCLHNSTQGPLLHETNNLWAVRLLVFDDQWHRHSVPAYRSHHSIRLERCDRCSFYDCSGLFWTACQGIATFGLVQIWRNSCCAIVARWVEKHAGATVPRSFIIGVAATGLETHVRQLWA